MSLENCNKRVKELLGKNHILENPLVKGFLEDDNYFNIFETSILEPTEENKNKVEEAFKNYYEKIRINAYFNNLIRYYAIDFDKKIRKINNRYTLTLDKPIDGAEEGIVAFKDLIENESIGEESEKSESSLKEEVSNELLFRALAVLTDFQYQILDLIYVKNLTKTQIANLINSTPQNISNTHRRALNKLKKNIVGENIND
ncbi:sigma-70 family RNA polymerase sigma factor [Schinkia azotoformans]|uniref:sigma-70 family RNA polymerase sigma factor n=2 Tax=Schinkia azotoformans TaxID=1454 RepID=UPI002DB7234E|nr:sigma-70 family RNA polymerase sigma factor [Schinkia azotoformans]MEC1739928.1 sigma-70 family RNA polymerase sigma factor [Schinkia azotoformans]MEC1746790.1 sigma-70 family RNA polymerase sigma factor [Schinkia azotoformans]MEC1767662.1 sigma-70 family RNA polymerase sigma factor [Schinkia azotoformans]MEC1778098.1 sigma-70 family RNA polymerase sigma factor [Schinkia azotoformans]MED4328158.1 sigma-70 family RNA polymerase sigma factor [Schinkia azotoformans]